LAIADYSTGIKLGSKNSEAFLNLSELYLITGEYAKAKVQVNGKTFKGEEACISYFLLCVSNRLLHLENSADEAGFEKALAYDFELNWSFELMNEFITSKTVSESDKIYIGELIKKMETKRALE